MRVIVVNKARLVHASVEDGAVSIAKSGEPSTWITLEEFDAVAEAVAVYRRAVQG